MEIISQNNTATNTTAIEFSFTAEEFENAISAAYNKRKKSVTVPASARARLPARLSRLSTARAFSMMTQ